MKGKCNLYDTIDDLRESHIYPKFVVKYFIDTGSKYMRNFIEPNKRLQDGPKLYLLSEKAEQIFSKREKWFSENIFIPYLKDGKSSFEYNEHLFCNHLRIWAEYFTRLPCCQRFGSKCRSLTQFCI